MGRVLGLAIPVLVWAIVVAVLDVPPRSERPEAESPPRIRPPIAVEDASSAELAAALARAYEAKLDNPAYVAWKNAPEIARDSPKFPEELEIRRLRAAIALRAEPPAGALVRDIPLLAAPSEPRLERLREEDLWSGALELEVGVSGNGARLFLSSDGTRLRLGAAVPSDRTSRGFDQLRFYYHVGLSPVIVNERIHVSPTGVRVIRETTVRWRGAPARNDDERWKSFAISDWSVVESARGGGVIAEGRFARVAYRQFEAELDLAEAGLHAGVAFPAFVEIESDPVLDSDGRFVSRTIAGRLGSQSEPVWLRVAAPLELEASGGSGPSTLGR